MIARALALLGLPTWLFPVGLAALVASGLGAAYLKGRGDANDNCRAASLERALHAEAAAVSRYRSALEASQAQRNSEAVAAAEREKELAARLAEIEVERLEQEKAAADLETDLAAAIQDKGKLDALVSKLRASARTDCRASDRDIDLDQRMRGK